jgi:hypothetical protein
MLESSNGFLTGFLVGVLAPFLANFLNNVLANVATPFVVRAAKFVHHTLKKLLSGGRALIRRAASNVSRWFREVSVLAAAKRCAAGLAVAVAQVIAFLAPWCIWGAIIYAGLTNLGKGTTLQGEPIRGQGISVSTPGDACHCPTPVGRAYDARVVRSDSIVGVSHTHTDYCYHPTYAAGYSSDTIDGAELLGGTTKGRKSGKSRAPVRLSVGSVASGYSIDDAPK